MGTYNIRAMGAFLDGMGRLIVLHATPEETAIREAWESVGQDLWWAVEEFNRENNIELVPDQMELPFARKQS